MGPGVISATLSVEPATAASFLGALHAATRTSAPPPANVDKSQRAGANKSRNNRAFIGLTTGQQTYVWGFYAL
jgi:hypothetical protein